jgi:glycosyltransferase involved in cell wall biosynthesis
MMTDRKNLIIQAPVFSLSGYGAHARDIVMALFNSGNFNISVVPVGWGGSSTCTPEKDVADALVFMCNNRIAEGVEFAWIQVGVPHEFRRVSAVANIGITAGLEVEQYPQKWAEYCNQMTAIIVPSKFVRDRLITCGVKVPVYVVPEGVDTKVFNDVDPVSAIPSISQLEFPTKFNFLTVGQWLQGEVSMDRKNIPATIMTVLDAFIDNPEVGIVVKTYMHNQSSPDRYALLERMSELLGPAAKGRVHFVHGAMSNEELSGLYHHPQIKAFVSLTHGEGYFRPLAEAAACNLPIIVTGYSGHMDYVNPHLTAVVDYDMGPVPQSMWAPELLGPGQSWANPNYEHAKSRLKRCYERYPVATERALKFGEVIRAEWSLERADKMLVETVETALRPTGTNIATLGRVMV